MTKTLLIIGLFILALLIAAFILANVAPKKIYLKNVLFINASKEEVFDQIRFMKKFPEWSPFVKQDAKQKYSISGIDGEIGATYHWEGVNEKSKGLQTIVALQKNSTIEIQCTITQPFEALPVFNYTITETGKGTNLLQEFEVALPAPSNIFALVFNLKEKMNQTNKQGLQLLKEVIENKRNLAFTKTINHEN